MQQILTIATAALEDPGSNDPIYLAVEQTLAIETGTTLLIRGDKYRVVHVDEFSLIVYKLAKQIPAGEPIWIGQKVPSLLTPETTSGSQPEPNCADPVTMGLAGSHQG